MPLTTAQRLQRVRVRAAELPLWRIRARSPIEGWHFDGEPISPGAPWPTRDGVARFSVEAAAPAHWPLEGVRLSLNVGGESLLTLAYGEGKVERFGLDPNHEEFPLRAHAVAISTESVSRLPFGQPVRAPKLERAMFVWVDLAVEALHRLLTQIAEAIEALGADEVVPHLLESAEEALRSLDWPSNSQAYVARIAPSSRQQTIWRLPPVDEDPAGLDDAQRASVKAAHAALGDRLAHLRRRFPPRGRLARVARWPSSTRPAGGSPRCDPSGRGSATSPERTCGRRRPEPSATWTRSSEPTCAWSRMPSPRRRST